MRRRTYVLATPPQYRARPVSTTDLDHTSVLIQTVPGSRYRPNYAPYSRETQTLVIVRPRQAFPIRRRRA